MASKHKKCPVQEPGVPGWVVTYGDMMTLLLCFFILLFSFSTIDVVKFREVIVELQGALGVLSGGPMVLNLGDIPAKQITDNPTASTRRMEDIQEKIEEKVEEENMQEKVETTINDRGLVIRFDDSALFDPGKADIKPEIMSILDVLGEELLEVSNYVAVEGHADSTPISTPEFRSNWELSTTRATAVIHYYIEVTGIAPDRLSAAGYSFYHPIVPNTTPENRARNRRVEVIILQAELEPDVETEVESEVEFDLESELEARRAALEFLESTESDGIVDLPDFGDSESADDMNEIFFDDPEDWSEN